ncbi:MAG: DEAD/DEAH box helicase [Thermoguttaceae bacterium]
MEIDWYPPPPPAVREFDLTMATVPLATGWNRGLSRPLEIATRTLDLAVLPPKVVSLAIRRQIVPTRSFLFDAAAEAPGWLAPKGGPALESTPVSGTPSRAPPSKVTRLKPPGDVIKLEDRLQYVLQPSLEAVVESRSLSFPFRPFPYQLEGIAFLFPRHAAILADEMGLGKTMQAITAVRLLLHSGELRTVLLICPKPLVANWQREFSMWAPEVPVTIIEGDQTRRRWQWALTDIPVKIANYEILHRDREVLEELGASGRPRLMFDLVILDESQRIKNRAGATSQAVRAIGRGRSWALTGTPVENSTEDLVGIFEFLAPGFLSPEMKPRRMGQAIGDYVLRRTKDQVLTDLPPKMFRDADLDLTPEQRQTYDLAQDEGVLRLTEMGDQATIHHVFELVLRLKQICNFDPVTWASSKLERLEADLEEVSTSGRKALVFSQWVQTLRHLAKRLARFGPLEYHGKIPSGQREDVIRRFREDPDAHVLLLSYGAGGVGLNLQFAGYVFLFDRWWNPALEDQAINRAHRIGAAGPVTVTRFLVLGTIEERINAVLQEKREIFEMIFSGAEHHRNMKLTQQQIFGLFDLKCPGGPLTAAA